MPVHLEPFQRRKFLAGSAGSVAALLLSEHAAAADRRVDADRFALISDTHIDGNPKKTSRGINLSDNLTSVVKRIAALETAPSGAIVCGDLAFNTGMVDDYKQFASIIRPLCKAKLPVHLMMGNHDHRGNLYSVLTECRPEKPVLKGKHISILQSPLANWFLLDSLEKTNSTPGLLGREQLKWLARELDNHTDRPAIVMTHHDPQLTRISDPGRKPGKMVWLKDSDPLLDVIVKRKHVKAHIFGHRHGWTQMKHEGIHIVGLPATAYMFKQNQPSAWVMAQVKEKGISLELRSLDPKHTLHGQKIDLAWRES